MARRKPVALYVMAGIALAAIVAVVVAVEMRPTPSQFVDGRLTRAFDSTTACTAVSIPLVANEGVELQEEGGRLIDALKGIPSIGDVTVYLEPARIDVEYCESSTTDAEIRQALEQTGIVRLGASVPIAIDEGVAPAAGATATADPSE